MRAELLLRHREGLPLTSDERHVLGMMIARRDAAMSAADERNRNDALGGERSQSDESSGESDDGGNDDLWGGPVDGPCDDDRGLGEEDAATAGCAESTAGESRAQNQQLSLLNGGVSLGLSFNALSGAADGHVDVEKEMEIEKDDGGGGAAVACASVHTAERRADAFVPEGEPAIFEEIRSLGQGGGLSGGADVKGASDGLSAFRSKYKRRSVHVVRPHDVASRDDLPVVREELSIMEKILNRDVVIICGETGSGKVRFWCDFILDGVWEYRDVKGAWWSRSYGVLVE